MHLASLFRASASANASAAIHHASHIMSTIMSTHVVPCIMHHVQCVVSCLCMDGAAGRVMYHVPVKHAW